MEPKTDFINPKCAICGNEDIHGSGTLSAITLTAGYGSVHDGEQITLYICGTCMDWFFNSLKRRV